MFSIRAIPTLLFFNDGLLIENNIEVGGEIRVQQGKMVGAAGEDILRSIIEKM